MSRKLHVYATNKCVVVPHGVTEKDTFPVLGAVQRYHADKPALLAPGNIGSFGSSVKPVLLSFTLPLLPLISRELMKLSFNNEPVFQLNTVLPVSPVTPSIAI